jgi:FdhD protein
VKNSVELDVLRINGSVAVSAISAQDSVAEEIPVAFEYNGIGHVVMLATPADLEDFAVGFTLTEGIVAHRQDIYDIEVEDSEAGITLRLDIASEAFNRLKERRRNLAGRTGCGLCGTESLSQVRRAIAALPAAARSFPFAALCAAMARLPALQPLQQTTGAAHAACWLDADGEPLFVREDIGRHNALDKTLGALARQYADPTGGAAIITSRASFEMVQKAAALGIALLAAVSAPTAAAVRLADELGLTLVGFLRDKTAVVYTHPHRLELPTKVSHRGTARQAHLTELQA